MRGEFAHLERDDGSVNANVQGYWLQAAYRLHRIFTERKGLLTDAEVSSIMSVLREGE